MAARDREIGGQPNATEDGEGFLGRWSRRKAEAKTAEETAAADPDELLKAEDPKAMPAVQEPDETPAFDVSTLPDIDSLGPGSDFSMFMQAGVPPTLKTRALRKLWRVKPELANLDGLLDYGEDLTGSFKVVDHLKTAYEVGRGFLRDQEEELPDGQEKAVDGDAVAEADTSEPPKAADTSQFADDAGEADAAPIEGQIASERPKA